MIECRIKISDKEFVQTVRFEDSDYGVLLIHPKEGNEVHVETTSVTRNAIADALTGTGWHKYPPKA